jgi:hypothetical protein
LGAVIEVLEKADGKIHIGRGFVRPDPCSIKNGG